MKTYLTLILLMAIPCLAENKPENKSAPELQNPPVEAIQGLPAKPEIIINVLEDGAIKVEGILVTKEELLEKLRTIANMIKDQPVRIRGDRKVPYGTIVDVIDVCRKAGISNISFSTIPTKQETEQAEPSNGDKPSN